MGARGPVIAPNARIASTHAKHHPPKKKQAHYLTSLWSTEGTTDDDKAPQQQQAAAAMAMTPLLLRLLEADPRLLVHGFGRVSRAGFVVDVRYCLCVVLSI